MLHALVAANSPALRVLDVSDCGLLRSSGLHLLLRALPCNTQLTTLLCNYNAVEVGDVDEAFAAGVLLPAVRANTSLTRLQCCEYMQGLPPPQPVVVQAGPHGVGLMPLFPEPSMLPSCVAAMHLVESRPL